MKSLEELSQLLQEADGDPEKMLPYALDLAEFAESMDKSATMVLMDKDVMGILSIVEGSAITALISKGELSVLQAIAIMSNKTLSMYSALILKYAIGLSVMEELR